MKDRTIQIPKMEKNNRYNIRSEPKKNLQVYIEQSTFKKMLKKMNESNLTLSQITEDSLEKYLE